LVLAFSRYQTASADPRLDYSQEARFLASPKLPRKITKILGHLLLKAAEVAKNLGISQSGFRLVFNNGPASGEAVPTCIAISLVARQLSWPAGINERIE